MLNNFDFCQAKKKKKKKTIFKPEILHYIDNSWATITLLEKCR